jgi:hypothetical protein
MLRMVSDMLNKQLRTVDRGWSSILGVGRGANNPHRKKIICYEMFNRASEAGFCEHGDEHSGYGTTELVTWLIL